MLWACSLFAVSLFGREMLGNYLHFNEGVPVPSSQPGSAPEIRFNGTPDAILASLLVYYNEVWDISMY